MSGLLFALLTGIGRFFQKNRLLRLYSRKNNGFLPLCIGRAATKQHPSASSASTAESPARKKTPFPSGSSPCSIRQICRFRGLCWADPRFSDNKTSSAQCRLICKKQGAMKRSLLFAYKEGRHCCLPSGEFDFNFRPAPAGHSRRHFAYRPHWGSRFPNSGTYRNCAPAVPSAGSPRPHAWA